MAGNRKKVLSQILIVFWAIERLFIVKSRLQTGKYICTYFLVCLGKLFSCFSLFLSRKYSAKITKNNERIKKVAQTLCFMY